jgi:hypothetical protein
MLPAAGGAREQVAEPAWQFAADSASAVNTAKLFARNGTRRFTPEFFRV